MITRGITQSFWILSLLALGACSSGGDGGGGGGGGPSTPVNTANYVVDFSPEQVIGAPAAPDSVTATASLSTASGDEITASGSITVSGANATSVTIHAGFAGENGPLALTLTDAGGGRWDIPANSLLDLAELQLLEVTGFYVSIQTPVGELRGQIRLSAWAVGVVDLDADSVVPASTSTATGKVGFGLNPQTGQFHVRVTVAGVGTITNVSINEAIAGARGNAIIMLEQSMSDANVWGTIDINDANAGNVLGQLGLELLLNGELYATVETVANMGGELRGQLIDGSVLEVFGIPLTPGEVVTSGAPVNSNATGVATVTWGESISLVAVAVNTDISNAISVTVHQGAAGQIGTVLFSLMPDPTLPGNWRMPVTQLDSAQVSALLNDEFYVNVVTAMHGEGELRGQIRVPAQAMRSELVGMACNEGDGVPTSTSVDWTAD